jgi:hypothetical protein
MSFGDQTKFLVCMKVASHEDQGRRSKPSQENHWIRIFTWYCISQTQGLKELDFDCRSHEVSSTEGLYGHVAHPIAGAAWLTCGANIECREKWKRVTGGGHMSSRKGVKPLLTYRISRIREGGAQGLNTPTREVASCEGC